MRFGKKYGFDFEKNRNQKVGVLRSFVKGEKEKNKRRDPELGDGELVLSELRQWRT